MNNKIYEMILVLLRESDFISSALLAEDLSISTRTVKRYIKDAPEKISDIEFTIESNKNGYKIRVLENKRRVLIEEVEKKIRKCDDSEIEWAIYLYVLSKKSITLDELSNRLHYSKGIILQKINGLKGKLSKYDINILSHNKGFTVKGEEENIRTVLLENLDIFNKLYISIIESNLGKNGLVTEIYEIILNELTFAKIICSHEQITLILKYIIISLFRIKHDDGIEISDNVLVYRNYILVKNISKKILEKFQLELSEKDNVKLSVLLGEKTFDKKKELEIRTCIFHALEKVDSKYNENFTHNNHILVNLEKHVLLCIQRLTVNVFLENPLRTVIRRKYFLAYDYATTFADELTKFLDIKFNEDEISYFTLYFQTYLEEKRDKQKYTALIICENGIGTSSLVRLQLETRFPKLKIIDVIPKYMIDKQKYENIDFIISTTNIPNLISKEIIYVSPVLSEDDFNKINKYLRTSLKEDYLKQLFREKLFFINLQMRNKEDVLNFIFNKLRSLNLIDDKSVDEVMQREEEVPTDLLPEIAFPHFVTNQYSFFLFLKLKEPIKWGKNLVEFVFFGGINIGEKQSKNIYPYMLKVFQKKSNVKDLREVTKLSDLIEILNRR